MWSADRRDRQFLKYCSIAALECSLVWSAISIRNSSGYVACLPITRWTTWHLNNTLQYDGTVKVISQAQCRLLWVRLAHLPIFWGNIIQYRKHIFTSSDGWMGINVNRSARISQEGGEDGKRRIRKKIASLHAKMPDVCMDQLLRGM